MKSLNELEPVQPKNCDPHFNNDDQVAPGNRLPQSCPKVASKQISKWVTT